AAPARDRRPSGGRRPANGQHSPHPFISDDARQRRPDRIYTLDELQVIPVDRRMLDTDQNLACGRCWRFGKVGKLKDDARLAERSELHCTHSAPPVLVMAGALRVTRIAK